MIRLAVYLYDSTKEDNGYRGENLTPYLLAGAQNNEDLTEEIDTTEITLRGLSRAVSFDPETKFIIDVYDEGVLVDTYHRIVQEDDVTKPILSRDDYFVHSLSLAEPSVIAQKRMVDDIAVTYLLKDVSLNTQPSFDVNSTVKTSVKTIATPVPGKNFTCHHAVTSGSNSIYITFGKYFLWQNSGGTSDIIAVYTKSGTPVSNIKKYKSIADIDNAKMKFEIPVPYIRWGNRNAKTYSTIGIASVDWKIVETDLDGNVTNTWQGTKFSNSDLYTNYKSAVTFPYDDSRFGWVLDRGGFNNDYDTAMAQFAERFTWLCESIVVTKKKPATPMFNYAFRQYSSYPSGSDLSNAQYTDEITVRGDFNYTVSVKLHNYGTQMTQYVNPLSATAQVQDFTTYTGDFPSMYCDVSYKQGTDFLGIVQDVAKNIDFYTVKPQNAQGEAIYDIFGSSDVTKMLEHAKPYTAYDLISKAIINSDVYFKQAGDYSGDIGSTSQYPFYVTTEETERVAGEATLRVTQVIENYYHQKNLWEMCLEVGKYIHAIPEIRFGIDDKFVILFNKLGGTKEAEKNQVARTIMNFRKVDDYISECSSYVNNLVQLGGEITEVVAPKTTDEDYLVSNKTAQIVVSKPIIEITRVIAKANKAYSCEYKTTGANTITVNIGVGETADITPFLYEKNVYKILDIDRNMYPNKGIAMYYELGTNVIVGGDYQLPQANTNAYSDYTFKKVLYCAFKNVPANTPKYPTDIDVAIPDNTPWINIRVSDFTFTVSYRTKDTARLEHIRPDLASYVLSTKHDHYPMHKQFNNQEDILVDSTAFGQNVYGKLIRTGNNNYKQTIWCKTYDDVPHKGDLVGGYYVAKATNIFLPNHIESIVEYSANYNKLSEVIGIPSEPRFWEISERNIIDREVQINDLLLITTDKDKIDQNNSFITDLSHTKDLIFGMGGTFLKWAKTTFKGDPDTPDGQEKIFGQRLFEKTVLNPINAYSSGGTLTYEWDMVDNFSAGDEVALSEVVPAGVDDDAYRTLRAVQYCDKYGKSALCSMELYGDELSLDASEIRQLPNAPTINETPVVESNDRVLFKDCREALHFNYNLMQIADNKFVTSPFFFTPKEIRFNPPVEAFFDGTKTPFERDWLVRNESGTELLNPIDGQVYLIMSSKNGTVQAAMWGQEEPTTAEFDTAISSQSHRPAQDGDVVNFRLMDNDNNVLECILYKRSGGAYTGVSIWNNQYGNFEDYVPVVYNAALDTYFNINYVNWYYNYRVVVLDEEISKFSNGYVNMDKVIYELSSAPVSVTANGIEIDLSDLDNTSWGKSIAVVIGNQSTQMQKFIVGKNFEVPNNVIFEPRTWYIGAPNKAKVFTNKQ